MRRMKTLPLKFRGVFRLGVRVLVALSASHFAMASDGDLDPDFSGDGKVSSDFGNPFNGDAAVDVVIQPDGKIVIGGRTRDFGDLARYHPDGSLDTSFGGDGSSAGSSISVQGIALQSDGKIVVAGGDTVIGTGVDFALARFNANGSLDDGSPGDSTPGDSFGIGGRVTTDFGDDENARCVAIQSDGKIVAAGHRGATSAGPDVDIAMARYNSDGSLDDGTAGDSTPGDVFGTAGKVRTDFAGDEDVARDVIIQSDGKILVAGHREFNGNPSFALARYLPTGAPDTSFDTDGRLNTAFNGNSFANAVAVQSNGKIVAAGAVTFGIDGSNFALARYLPNGTLDNSFGPNSNGRAFADIVPLGEDQINDLALQSDGRIVVGGFKGSFNTNNATFALARFLPTGTLDNSFGTGGIVTTDYGAFPGDFSAGINAVALQSDGRIVAAGSTRDNQFSSSEVVLARYTASSLTAGLQPDFSAFSGNSPTLRIGSLTGFTYQLQTASSPSAADFTSSGAVQQGSTGTALTFTAPTNAATRGFYRILIQPVGF
jgi:uncharacterized delta-60 repeat protein